MSNTQLLINQLQDVSTQGSSSTAYTCEQLTKTFGSKYPAANCKQLRKTLRSKCPAVDWLIVVYCSSVNFATTMPLLGSLFCILPYGSSGFSSIPLCTRGHSCYRGSGTQALVAGKFLSYHSKSPINGHLSKEVLHVENDHMVLWCCLYLSCLVAAIVLSAQKVTD